MFRNLRQGDKVKVKSERWYVDQADSSGSIVLGKRTFTSDHARYCGAILEVVRVNQRNTDIRCSYNGTIVSLTFNTDMFDPYNQNQINKIIEEEFQLKRDEFKFNNPLNCYKIYYKGGDNNLDVCESLIAAKTESRARIIWEESNNIEKFLEIVEEDNIGCYTEEEKIII